MKKKIFLVSKSEVKTSKVNGNQYITVKVRGEEKLRSNLVATLNYFNPELFDGLEKDAELCNDGKLYMQRTKDYEVNGQTRNTRVVLVIGDETLQQACDACGVRDAIFETVATAKAAVQEEVIEELPQ